jgi:hypothetical protein
MGEWTPPGSQTPLPWFALEFVAGGSLAGQLRKRLPSPTEAAHLVEILARAVHHAHEAGIIHRDLKPDNVLLAPPVEGSSGSTAFGFPKVADFGLARLLEEEGQTVSGAVLGTPAYMAPEQTESSSDVGPSCDVYALGAILYRLLGGRVPFEGSSVFDTLLKVRSEPPLPLRELNQEVPARLEAICLKALSKSPSGRPPSAAALADELCAWRESAPRGGARDRMRSPESAETREWSAKTEDATTARLPAKARSGAWFALLAVPVVLLGLVGLVAWRLWSVPQPSAPVKQEVPALKGFLDVAVTEVGNPRRRNVWLADPASRPLRVGDEVRVRVELNRPAFCYVVWVDTQGKVLPVYPWIEGDWTRRREERAVPKLSLPDTGVADVWKIEPGPPGMETLVLLTRETPLPADVDLAGRLGEMGAQTLPNGDTAQMVAWFENGAMVREEGRESKFPRAFDPKGVESSDPVLRTQGRIQKRVGGLFGYVRAAAFPNIGGK